MTNSEVFEKMHEEFILRGLSSEMEISYRQALRMFLRYHENREIETLGESDIRSYLLHQLSIGKSSGTVNIHNSALRFAFGGVLGRNLNCRMIPRRRHHREIPDIMSKDEIVRFFSVIDNLRDRAMFETVYGAALRPGANPRDGSRGGATSNTIQKYGGASTMLPPLFKQTVL